MRAVVVRAKRLSGELSVPGDKSISHRAVLLGAMARGTTRVTGIAPGGDVRTSMECVKRLGVTILDTSTGISIQSPGRDCWNTAPGELDAGNSGTTARLLMGMLAPVTGMSARILGDPSLSKRPMKRVAEPLGDMGASVLLNPAGTLPARVFGAALHGVNHRLFISSAQVKTALLLAGLGAEGATWVDEPSPSRDHTERMLPAFGARALSGDLGIRVTKQALSAANIVVPGDPSSAAFFAVAASIVDGSAVRIFGAGTNPTRTGVLEALADMGAPVALENPDNAVEPFATWACSGRVAKGTNITGSLVARLVDEIPILTVAAAVAPGVTTIREAGELRVKESDRLKGMADGLNSMGADVEELPDGLIIHGGRPLHGARIDAGMDHRIAMSFAVAGLAAEGETVIEGAQWADISFPGFFRVLSELSGGAVRVE